MFVRKDKENEWVVLEERDRKGGILENQLKCADCEEKWDWNSE